MTLVPVLTRLAAARARIAPHALSLLRWCAIGALSALVAASVLLSPSAFAGAADGTQGSVAANRLKIGTLVEFDARKSNVGDAIRFLLEPVHYRITMRTVDPTLGASVLRRPIPPIAVHAGVMSIESALLLLIGEDNRLVVDHTNRLIAIERMPAEADPSPR